MTLEKLMAFYTLLIMPKPNVYVRKDRKSTTAGHKMKYKNYPREVTVTCAYCHKPLTFIKTCPGAKRIYHDGCDTKAYNRERNKKRKKCSQ